MYKHRIVIFNKWKCTHMWLKATLLNGPMFNCWQETISSYLHEKMLKCRGKNCWNIEKQCRNVWSKRGLSQLFNCQLQLSTFGYVESSQQIPYSSTTSTERKEKSQIPLLYLEQFKILITFAKFGIVRDSFVFLTVYRSTLFDLLPKKVKI